MGEAELNYDRSELIISSHIIIYGKEADLQLAQLMRDEIEAMWNEPGAVIEYKNRDWRVIFQITAECRADLPELEVLKNTNPVNNYFRIENFVHGDISFVDGLGSNTGYFKKDNLYEGSTTAAHEYGHTLGLPHPRLLDVRGEGVPGIMYPRGTIVDPEFQYDPSIQPGKTGGTMHPKFRKVRQQDIEDLRLHRLRFENDKAVVGSFTSIFHFDHAEVHHKGFTKPPIRG